MDGALPTASHSDQPVKQAGVRHPQTITTVARFGDRLAAVNAKLDTGPPPTATQYEVVVLDR